jgi:predicted HTH domain antitoxin
MSITIPDEVLESVHLTAEDALQEMAVALFQREELTLGQASRLAGMDRLRFQHLLASRGIPLHYDVAELEADLQVLRETGRL